MKKACALFPLLLILVLSMQAFGQSSNASLSGTVSDATGGMLVGVTVTATSVATNVVAVVTSNNTGLYSFASLLPGSYTVTAERKGFRTATYTGVTLGSAQQVRLNFKMEVAGLSMETTVTTDAATLVLEGGSTSSETLGEEALLDLPLVNNNALDLIKVMSAYVPTGNSINGANEAAIGGVSVSNLNIQRDGVSVSDVRYPAGIHAPTQINPEMVGEFKMVTAPVDAEMGRGFSQIQIQTKSGTNQYHGSAVWDIQNSALDSNTYEFNHTLPRASTWRNVHQYTISLGGPIIKNKTFFFALFNGQIARGRDSYNATVLTPCARKGIFRYFDGWSNGRYGSALSLSSTAPTYASVDQAGNPVAPPAALSTMLNADGSHKANWVAHNGILRYASVFGAIQNASAMAPDCSNAIVSTATGITGGGWDDYRKPIDSSGFRGDSSGYLDSFLEQMPQSNNYDQAGDGLNTATNRWTRGFRGNDNLYGVGEDNQRKQINIKINHNISMTQRFDVSWSFEKGWSDNNLRVWPNGFGGYANRQPQVLTGVYTSNLTSRLVNEARFGMSRTGTNLYGPMDNPETGKQLLAILPEINGLPLIVNPGTGGAAFSVGSSNLFGGRWAGLPTITSRDVSPRYSFSDNVTWMKNRHMFKMGIEFRFNRSNQTVYGTTVFNSAWPLASGGNASAAQFNMPGINTTNMPGLQGTDAGNNLLMKNLLSLLSGSLGSASQNYFLNNSKDVSVWNDPLTEYKKNRSFRQKEISFFFKDDWKINEWLTFLPGVRYEYYGVPYYGSGMTVGLDGGPGAAFGISGRSWDEAFWKPGARADLTTLQFVGPGSPNPDNRPYNLDRNNFAPNIGFNLQLPWLGKGKTVLRGGYGISFVATGRAAAVDPALGNAPGSNYTATYTATNAYLSLANIASIIPVAPAVSPMKAIPLTERTQTLTIYDPTYETPYVHTLTLWFTRNFGTNLTVDLKYNGSLARRQDSTFNMNLPNFLTNGLKEAFDAARYGMDDSAAAQLLDQIFAPVRGAQSGAAYLRNSNRGAPTARRLLARGNYQALATMISNWSNPNAAPGTTTNGWLLSQAGLPDNFIVTNPQFATVNIMGNKGYSNYHSMQAQVTMRPKAGLSFQTSYTWSKNLGLSGNNPTDPRNFDLDYTLTSSDRRHTLTSYGNFDLPLGPKGVFFNNATGFVARLIEKWSASWIATMTSGAPGNFTTAVPMLYGTGVPDLVGKFPYDKVRVWWEKNALRGNYFQNQLLYVNDPQRNDGALATDPQVFGKVTAKNGLNAMCDLYAIADPNNTTILQNPLPGNFGNFGQNRITYPGSWNVDMALSKAINFGESKSMQIRVDVTNIFNHPTPAGTATAVTGGSLNYFAGPPNTSLGGGTVYVGDLNDKVGRRTFQAKIRFAF